MRSYIIIKKNACVIIACACARMQRHCTRTDLSRLEHAHTCKVKYASTFNPGNNKDSPIEMLLLIRCCKGVEEYLNKLVLRRYLHRAHCYSY